jgi:uncharacterized cupredoxin-like copper-binding protein
MSKLKGTALALLGLAALAAFTACGDDEPKNEVAVSLTSFQVTADKTTVPAGKTRFTASNAHATDVHELAVLLVKADGSYDNLGEVEDIDPGKGGDVTIDLKPGKYLLACLITPGEAGSTADHLGRGMRLDFEVQ